MTAKNTVQKTAREADKFVVRMPDGMRLAVEEASGEQFTSMNTFVLQAITEKLDRDQRQELLLTALANQLKAAGDAASADTPADPVH